MTVIHIGSGGESSTPFSRARTKGRRNPQAKLYAHQVRRIRKVYVPRDPQFGYRGLSREYGVSYERIREIILGRAWKHLL
jgi:hypothetical protein